MIKSTWFLGGTACPDGDEIRKKVFVNEQKYPISVEFDDHDKTCDHLLLTVDGTPAATARVFMTDEQTAKIGRLTVLKEYRGQHLGAELIKELKKRSKALGAKKIYVSAQVYAVPFYEKYGFRAYGNEYLDIHIPHMDMDCPL